jgi:outer membrane protein assembly factor BamB
MPILPDRLLLPGFVPTCVNAGAASLSALVVAVIGAACLFQGPRGLLRAGAIRLAVSVLLGLGLAGAPGDGFAGAPPAGAASSRQQGPRQEYRPSAGSATQEKRALGKAVMFGVSALRNGYQGGGSPVGLRPAWQFPSPGTPAASEMEGASVLSSPIVAGADVFGASCVVEVLGNYGSVFCLDAASGRLRWKTEGYKDATGKEQQFRGFFSSPAVTADGKSLVIGQGLHPDEKCELLCFDTATGRLRWHVPTPLHLESSPAIDGDFAVVGAGAVEDDNHKPKGHPGVVLAVKVSTGERLWEHPVIDPESSPAIADGIVYIGSGFNGKAVVALRTESDDQLKKKGLERQAWRTPTPHPATGPVTLTDALVIVGCGNSDYVYTDPRPEGALVALDRETGGVRWQLKMPDSVLGKVAVCEGRAVLAVRNGEVVCLDLNSTGGPREVWRHRVHGDKPLLAGPAFTGACVYAVAGDGYLAVLDAKDGHELEHHGLNAKGRPGENSLCVSSPLVALGRVYVGSETGGLRCFVGKDVKP